MASAGYSIIKRKRGGREIGPWQIRIFVPASLQPAIGRKEVLRSLGTEDRRQAERNAVAEAARLYAEWGQLTGRSSTSSSSALARHTPSLHELEEAATFVGFDMSLEGMDQGRANLRGTSPVMWAAHVRFEQQRLAQLAQQVATRDTASVEDQADQAIEVLGWDMPKASASYRQFCELIAQANLAALKLSDKRNAGDVDADTDSKIVRRVKEREAATAPAGETILELFERYAEQRLAEKRKRPDGINQDRKKLQQFAAFVGEKRLVRSIERAEVLKYRTILDTLPKKWRDTNAYRGMSMEAAATKAKAAGAAPLAKTTVNGQLSAISSFFDWMVEVGYADKNPGWAVLPVAQRPKPAPAVHH